MELKRNDICVGLVVEKNIVYLNYLRKMLYALDRETKSGIDLLNINYESQDIYTYVVDKENEVSYLKYPIISQKCNIKNNRLFIQPCYNLDDRLKLLGYKEILTMDDINRIVNEDMFNLLDNNLINNINMNYFDPFAYSYTAFEQNEILKQFIPTEEEIYLREKTLRYNKK